MAKIDPKVIPFLWMDGTAEDAANFYVSLFPDSEILRVRHTGAAGPGPEGSVLSVDFTVAGQTLVALNGGPQFQLTPGFSLMVLCEDQAEIDRLWDALVEGGQPMMCGWVTDRFGLSWQIVPERLGDMLWGDGDPARASRVMAAMMTMVKLDLPALEAAYRDEAA